MTRDSSSDVAQIKALLCRSIEALARELLPDGQRMGVYWKARCPWRADKHVGSFWVNLRGQMQGTYHDAAAGETGDALTLIAKVHGLDPRNDFPKVLAWARSFLGLGDVAPAEMKRRAAQAAETGEAERAAAEAQAAEDRKRAFGLFVRAKKEPFLGSPADLYLQGRGIDVRRLGRLPGCLGWLPAWRRPDGSMTWPCMLAGFTGPSGKIVSTHRTFLACAADTPPASRPAAPARGGPDTREADEFWQDFGLAPPPEGSPRRAAGSPEGSRPAQQKWGKAPVEPARKIWPSFGGAAIRLWRGESGLREAEAAKHGLLETLVLCEGVEDGLSIALARPDLRLWCAGSLGNLAALQLPECCDRVIVAADNDWGKRQAARQLDKALSHLAGQGREVAVARSPIGKDANDALLSGARRHAFGEPAASHGQPAAARGLHSEG